MHSQLRQDLHFFPLPTAPLGPYLSEKQNPNLTSLSGPAVAGPEGVDLWSGSRWAIAVLGTH